MKKVPSLDRLSTTDKKMQHCASHTLFIGGDKPLEMTDSKLEFDHTAKDTYKNLTARRQRLIQSGAISELEFNSIGA